MNYASYVAAAYAVFVAGMLWDWLSPWLQTRRALRAATLRARRHPPRAATTPATKDQSPSPTTPDSNA